MTNKRVPEIFLHLVFWSILFALFTHIYVFDGFQTVNIKLNLNSKNPTQNITLPNNYAPLKLKLSLILNSNNSNAIEESFIVQINNQLVKTINAQIPSSDSFDLSRQQHYTIVVSPKFIHKGDNIITLNLGSSSKTSFAAELKIYNYNAISPNIPIVYVLNDPLENSTLSLSNLSTASKFLKTFSIAFFALTLFVALIRFIFYNNLKQCVLTLDRSGVLLTIINSLLFLFVIFTPYSLIFPAETILWLIVLILLITFMIGTLIAGYFFNNTIVFLLPGNRRGYNFSRELIDRFHNVIYFKLKDCYGRKIFNAAIVTSLSIPVFIFWFHILRYGINIPIMDDFGIFFFIDQLENSNKFFDKANLFFYQSHENRSAIFRFISWVTYLIKGEIDFKVVMIVGNTAFVGLMFLFYRLLNIKDVKLLYYTPCVFILFTLSTHTAMRWANGSVDFFFIQCLAGWSLFCLTRPGKLNFLISICLALSCSYVMAGGIFVYFLGLLLLISNKKSIDKLAIWFALGLLNTIFYFHNYTFHIAHLPEGISFEPGMFFIYFLGALLSVLGKSVAVFGGVLAVVYFIVLTLKKYYLTNPAIYFYIAFILAIALAGALTRSTGGAEIALVSRYKLNSTVLLILFYLSWVDLYLRNNFKRKLITTIYICLFSILLNFKIFKEHSNTFNMHRSYLINEAEKLAQVETMKSIYYDGSFHDSFHQSSFLNSLRKGIYHLP